MGIMPAAPVGMPEPFAQLSLRMTGLAAFSSIDSAEEPSPGCEGQRDHPTAEDLSAGTPDHTPKFLPPA